MVRIINAFECDCDTCNGGTPSLPDTYGGSLCTCPCHTKKGADRAAYIAFMKAKRKEFSGVADKYFLRKAKP